MTPHCGSCRLALRCALIVREVSKISRVGASRASPQVHRDPAVLLRAARLLNLQGGPCPLGGPGLRGLTADRLQVTRIHELLRAEAVDQLAKGHCPDGRELGDGLRPSDRGPGDRSPPCGLGADHRPDLLAAFVWPTFSQKLPRGWRLLGPSSRAFPSLVIDNFPAAVAVSIRSTPTHFLEYSQHRGFISDPARVRHPRDKPRVERGVPYVRERFRGVHVSDMRSC